MRLVLLCGVAQPKRKPLTPAERDKRWRLAHPDRVQARRERFREKNPTYDRDYWRANRA